MAALRPLHQNFDDRRIGDVVGYSRVKLESASDTLTVPTLASTTANASSAQVQRANDSAVTVTDDGANTVTIAGGTAGQEVSIVTLHGPATVNFGAEA